MWKESPSMILAENDDDSQFPIRDIMRESSGYVRDLRGIHGRLDRFHKEEVVFTNAKNIGKSTDSLGQSWYNRKRCENVGEERLKIVRLAAEIALDNIREKINYTNGQRSTRFPNVSNSFTLGLHIVDDLPSDLDTVYTELKYADQEARKIGQALARVSCGHPLHLESEFILSNQDPNMPEDGELCCFPRSKVPRAMRGHRLVRNAIAAFMFEGIECSTEEQAAIDSWIIREIHVVTLLKLLIHRS
ncbi:hypothetical protein QAD02_020588 [Eretmocerus hayati]|uniref:Uncharacterized protein n=1 Tax=Eretmocerus hayati TaxID=131215 RepID=A0ACC2PSM4_9HYME|nr:hypothetical protein QAD02_020588 [Eretmocerus hayati]